MGIELATYILPYQFTVCHITMLPTWGSPKNENKTRNLLVSLFIEPYQGFALSPLFSYVVKKN